MQPLLGARMYMLRAVLPLAALSLLVTGSASGQGAMGLRIGVAADARLISPGPLTTLQSRGLDALGERGREQTVYRKSYWKEGAIVGGVVFGALGFLVSQLDDADSGGHVSTVGLTVGGVALGALTGALIGSQMHPRTPPPAGSAE